MSDTPIVILAPGTTIRSLVPDFSTGRIRIRIVAPSRPISWEQYLIHGQQWHPSDLLAIDRVPAESLEAMGPQLASQIRRMVRRGRSERD